MKILKIDHLGIAVSTFDSGKKFWQDIMGLELKGTEEVSAQKVITGFMPVGESEVELLESTSPDGPIAKYIEKKELESKLKENEKKLKSIEEELDKLTKLKEFYSKERRSIEDQISKLGDLRLMEKEIKEKEQKLYRLKFQLESLKKSLEKAA